MTTARFAFSTSAVNRYLDLSTAENSVSRKLEASFRISGVQTDVYDSRLMCSYPRRKASFTVWQPPAWTLFVSRNGKSAGGIAGGIAGEQTQTKKLVSDDLLAENGWIYRGSRTHVTLGTCVLIRS